MVKMQTRGFLERNPVGMRWHVGVPPGCREYEGPPYEPDESRRQGSDVNDRNAGPDARTETEIRREVRGMIHRKGTALRMRKDAKIR